MTPTAESVGLLPFAARRTRRWPWHGMALAASDGLALTLSLTSALFLRWALGGGFGAEFYWRLMSAALLTMLVYAFHGLYPAVGTHPVVEMQAIAKSTAVSFLLIGTSTLFIRDAEIYSRSVLLLAWMFSTVLVFVMRVGTRAACARKWWWGERVIILGEEGAALEALRALQQNPQLGFRPVGILIEEGTPAEVRLEAGLIRGRLSLANEIALEGKIRYALAAFPSKSSDELCRLLERHVERFPHVLVIPDKIGLSSLGVVAHDLGGTLALEISHRLLSTAAQRMKRTLDLCLSAGALIFGFPLLASIAALVRITSPGPVLFGHARTGKDGLMFRAWKFRTMRVDGDELLRQHLAANPEAAQEWAHNQKLRDDPRVTSIGCFLRKTSLDELPQLWNVLMGEMSLVGPRPVVQAEEEKYGNRLDLYRRVLPGITGLWQVSGRNNTTYEARVKYDEYYVRNWSVWLDLYLLFRTIRVVLTREGAY